MKRTKNKNQMQLRRNGPNNNPWTQWGRKREYGGKDLWNR